MIEKLSFTSVRQSNSSIFGSRKNGLPKRKEGSFGLKPPPAPVSAVTFDWKTLILIPASLHEVDQSQPLTVEVTVYQSLLGWVRNDRSGNGTRGWPNRIAQVSACQSLANTFKSKEEKGLVLADGSAHR